MQPDDARLLALTRRHFFGTCGVGLGKIALASLLTRASLRAETPATHRVGPDHAPRAKRVIWLFMAGGPSHLDLFDPKPTLQRLDGQLVPAELVKDQRYAFINPQSKLLGPRFPFAKHGDSGAELAEVLPHLAQVVDRVTFLRAVTTEQFNHAPAQIFANTGFPQPGRPAMGSWVTYGLGSETDDLPAFVVLSSGGGTSGGSANWSHGFLPGEYAGVPLRGDGDPILDTSSPAGVDDRLQSDTLRTLRALNAHRHELVGDPAIATRIAAYEMAHRMQTAAPEATDFSRESPATLALYGADPKQGSFARNCLLARRLVERGVRFVQVYHKGWDHHADIEGGLRAECGRTDRACAALLLDLSQRGMLDDTLVIWGGEFGRTPMVENSPALHRLLGRDHHPHAFTMWLAGGGVKPGVTFGATDELGFHAVEGRVDLHDVQATVLWLLGLDHERLTFRHQGRDFRLTDVGGKVVHEVLA